MEVEEQEGEQASKQANEMNGPEAPPLLSFSTLGAQCNAATQGNAAILFL